MAPAPVAAQHAEAVKKPVANNGEQRADAPSASGHKSGTSEDGTTQNEDPARLTLDADLLVPCLEKFHQERDERRNEEQITGVTRKKKANYQTPEEKLEAQKQYQKRYWKRLTTILSDQKLSVWKALDKALSKYYSMLVTR